MGRVLNTQTIDGSAEVSINQPTGVYMLRLVTDDDVNVAASAPFAESVARVACSSTADPPKTGVPA